MASVSFRHCECGIRLRIVQEQDGQRQVYTCSCGRRISFDGTVLLLHFSVVQSPLSDYDWTKVPSSDIRDVY
jgi:hypothetical protein